MTRKGYLVRFQVRARHVTYSPGRPHVSRDQMSRNDGQHPEKPRRHHAAMHSGRKGSGHDAKIRNRKRTAGDRRALCPFCGHPTVDVSRHRRTVH